MKNIFILPFNIFFWGIFAIYVFLFLFWDILRKIREGEEINTIVYAMTEDLKKTTLWKLLIMPYWCKLMPTFVLLFFIAYYKYFNQ